jgi:GTP cyclohydrolase I
MKSGENVVLVDKEMTLYHVEEAYGKFLEALGYDWKSDPNMQKTPHRVAKMMVNEITRGAYETAPNITVFPNNNSYLGMVFEGNIKVHSICSHHMLPFVGESYVAYIPGAKGNLIGLSKLNRIVHWFMRRPQLQEALTMQIHDYIDKVLGDNLGVAVMIKAQHQCVLLRGAEDNSIMCTAQMSKRFLSDELHSREEFYKLIDNCQK